MLVVVIVVVLIVGVWLENYSYEYIRNRDRLLKTKRELVVPNGTKMLVHISHIWPVTF